MWHDHDIDFARWLHPAVWHLALESWRWIHQVAAPCNVIRGSGMTYHWIHPVAAPSSVTLSSGIITLNSPVSNTMQCGRLLWDDMPLNLPKRPPCWNFTSGVNFDHITTHQLTCHSAPVSEILAKSDHPQQKKITSCRFWRWWISAILDFRDSIMVLWKAQLHNFL